MKPVSHFERLDHRLRRAWQERAITLKAASFAAIGVVNTLVDFGIFVAAYSLLELPLIPANVLAWLVAVTGSYVMNSYITFAAESGRRLAWRAYGAFVASGVAGVIANTATLVVASYWVPVLAAKVMAIAASFAVNFSLSNFVVFRTRQGQAQSSAETYVPGRKPDR
jgi:putative flippase GtrA